MRVIHVRAQSFGSNTYLIVSGTHALVVDPAVSVSAIVSTAGELGASIDGILLTHGHYDHMLSLDTLRQTLHVPAMIHKNDAVMLTDGKKNAFYAFYGQERVFGAADETFEDGDELCVGDERFCVIHTPGHTGGSCCFVCGNALITGDTLFAEGIGRCDLWSGDIDDMRDSLSRLRTLDPELRIRPGHGMGEHLGFALPASPISKERPLRSRSQKISATYLPRVTRYTPRQASR